MICFYLYLLLLFTLYDQNSAKQQRQGAYIVLIDHRDSYILHSSFHQCEHDRLMSHIHLQLSLLRLCENPRLLLCHSMIVLWQKMKDWQGCGGLNQIM